MPKERPLRREVYSIPESQRILGGISRTLMFDLIKSGEIKTIKVGSRRLIPRSSIDAFLVNKLLEEDI
jgi:excisionase family DNA binding protein